MNTSTKLNIFLGALVVLLILSIGIMAKIGWDKYQLEQTMSQLNEKLMEANLEVGKAETRFGEAQDKIQELENEVAEWIETNDEQMEAYGELYAKYSVAVNTPIPSAEVRYVTQTIIHTKEFNVSPGLWLAQSARELSNAQIEVPYSDHRISIGTSVWSEEYGKIAAEVDYSLNLTLKGQIVQTTTKSGAVNYYVNLYEVDPDGNVVGKLQLDSFEVITQDLRKSQMFWWNPHLDVSGFTGLGKGFKLNTGVAIGFSFMGYGVTENDLMWRFPNISLDVSTDTVGLGLTPVQWNAGQLIPVISNCWVGPHIGINIDQEWYVGIAIGAML